MKLLVALDLSDSTEEILKQVVELTRPLQADVWLIHNAEPEPDNLEFKVDPLSARDSLAEKFHKEHLQIQDIAEQLRTKNLNITALLVHGAIIETIVKEAEKLDVDMIVVGTHNHSAMSQLILGSVSEGIVHKSNRPVLVIPVHKNNVASKSSSTDPSESD